MDTSNFITDDGCCFSLEDYITLVKWKTEDLIKEGWSEESIRTFIEDDTWAHYSVLFYTTINEKELQHNQL